MRYVHLGAVTPDQSIAIDRAVFESREKGLSEDTIHVYSRDRRTVSLGRFGDRSALLPGADGIPCVRRMSGGGTILTGPGQIVLSVTLGGSMPSRDLSFEMICGGISDALKDLGMAAEYRPPNDVLAFGKKISGGAQYRTAECMLHHATLIVEGDPSVWDVLPPPRGARYNGLTSVAECIGRVPDRAEVARLAAERIAERLGFGLEPGRLTEWESERSGITASVSDL
ncbi:MAG: lipoate--protein ligase family protein [Candidatus Methanoplasma sp.]|jgi:lipoate-protein ligase A|nr:lipoate--protein ligase family protein [Candidatus Methanoplasma sp.]